MIPTLPLSGAFAVLCLATAAAGADSFRDSVPAPDRGTLVVELSGGSVEIETHDEPEVRAESSGDGDTGFSLRVDGDEVHFSSLERGWLAALRGSTPEVRLRVPRLFSVDVRTSGGNVDVEAVQGAVRARTSGGSVVVEGARGPVDLETSGGNIEAENIVGDLVAQTSGGSIRADAVHGAVEVETSGGDLELRDVWGPVRAYTSGGSIEVRFLRPPAGRIETSGGSIELELPADAGVELDAETSGGRVELDETAHFVGERSRTRARGALNDGGARLQLRTSGGNIELHLQ